MFILGNGGIGWRGCVVEMFQLKIIPLFPCFKRVTCQEPAPELAFSYIFIHMWWNWWYPFFLFISETTCPLPSKVRRRGQATPSGLCVRHFVFFLTQWLATSGGGGAVLGGGGTAWCITLITMGSQRSLIFMKLLCVGISGLRYHKIPKISPSKI